MKHINPEATRQAITRFIKKTFKNAGFTKAVIALSGGIDSSVSCALSVHALGKENIFPILLPHGDLNKQGELDAMKVIKYLGIPKKNVTKINIQKPVDIISRIDTKMGDIRKGNIMTRVRMIFIFDQAKKINALVMGTENKTEHLLGYYTRFGDEASDVEPLRNLYKTQIYELAKFLQLPKFIITKKPTAGLWENQTDETEFGFTYKDADGILYNYFEKGISVEQIVEMNKIKKSIVENVLEFAKKNSFKLNLPYVHEK